MLFDTCVFFVLPLHTCNVTCNKNTNYGYFDIPSNNIVSKHIGEVVSKGRM